MNYTIITIVVIIAFLISFLGFVAGIIYGGSLEQQKVLDCIKSGQRPMECKCAIKYCS